MSREPRPWRLYGFASTHEALDAEEVFEAAGLDSTTVPAPPALSARCGIALRLPVFQAEKADACLAQAGIKPAARIVIQDF